MNRELAIRRVRIAVSAVFALLCVAIVVYWVRSYSWGDSAHCPLPGKSVDPNRKRWVRLPDGTRFEPSPKMLVVDSYNGFLSLYVGEVQPQMSSAGWFPWGWGTKSVYIGDLPTPSPITFSWKYDSDKYRKLVRVPHWFPALVIGVLAAACGIGAPYRFSLRTLLIATTLIAVALGLVAFAMR
jgi:hypothetical protein